MATNRVISRIDGVSTWEHNVLPWIADMGPGTSLKKLTANETITDAQRRWYKGVCLRELVKNDENGETIGWWDWNVKRKCKGLAYLKKEGVVIEVGGSFHELVDGRLTTTGVGIRNMTNFIEEILSQAMQRGWPVSAPDPELRR